MTKKGRRIYPEKKDECQFCRSKNYDTKTSTCRDCGTTAPANPPALLIKEQTFLYLSPKAEKE